MKPSHIIDNAGRIGIITEQRDNGVFARPADMPAAVDCGGGSKLITATYWAEQSDGTLRGLWCDSKPHGFTTAQAASAMGKKGGSATSQAKKDAARANGAKGGRPRKRPSGIIRVSGPQAAENQ
jgi:hypothetical protein